jgi:tagatose 6-phosphate kinase
MFLCVALNAAIDKTVVIENFRPDAVHRPSYELVLGGGKSCNVARAARTLGQPAIVTGWVGGHCGRFIEDLLREEGLQTAFVHTAIESRTCLSIQDPASGTTTEIYENGRPVTPADLQTFREVFTGLLPQVEYVTLSGSLPPGAPDDFYAELSCLARQAGARAVIDVGGAGLRQGIDKGCPFMIKCNRSELASAAGEPLDGMDDLNRAVMDLSVRRETLVAITLGGAGAVAADGACLWVAQAPRIRAVSAVGSGDAFLAGLLTGLRTGLPFEECLRLGVAAGSANALMLGAGRLRREDVETLRGQVQIRKEKHVLPGR